MKPRNMILLLMLAVVFPATAAQAGIVSENGK